MSGNMIQLMPEKGVFHLVRPHLAKRLMVLIVGLFIFTSPVSL